MTWRDHPVQANALQWDGRSSCHFEAFDIVLMAPEQGAGWWFRYALDAPVDGEPSSTLWGGHFSAKSPGQRFVLRSEFPIRAFGTLSDGFHIRVSKAELTRDAAKGGLRNPQEEGQSLRWNLQFSRQADPLQTYPKSRMYARTWPPMGVLEPMPLARAKGVVEVGEDRYQVKGAFAHQAHRWGTRHFDDWSWGLATGFRERPEAFVSGLRALPRVGGRTFTVLHYRDGEGNAYTFDEFSSKRAEEEPDQQAGVWTFEAKNRRHTLSGRISASLQKMAGARYTDPEGTPRFVHQSAVADATCELWKRSLGKNQLQQTLTAKGSAFLQQGAQRPFEDVAFYA